MRTQVEQKYESLVFKGDGYTLMAREPGAGRMDVPKGKHFLDVYLGKSDAPYVITGLESLGETSPACTFVFLPANGEQEITTSRSGWSVQLVFDPQLLPEQPILEDECEKDDGEEELGLRVMCHVEDETMVSLMRQLSGLWQPELPDPTSKQIEAVVTLLIMRVDRHIYNREAALPRAPSSPRRVQAVIDHIELNLNKPQSLDDLAEVAGVSAYHFARMFRQATGRSPHQYVVERRLAFAKRRLTQSDDPIVQIAHDSGFGSQSHMTDVFSKVLGITPGAIRRSGS